MAGLPKKYAKMGFKKGWREYRKVHPKKGSKKKATAKARSPSKKKPKPKKASGNMASNGNGTKNTPSRYMKLWAIGGTVADRSMRVMIRGHDAQEQFGAGIPRDYAGFDHRDGSWKIERMTRGYAGAFNDMAYRKFAKAAGFRAYPTGNPKNFSQYLDYLTMYGDTVVSFWLNKDNMHEGHRAAYEGQFGVDLNKSDFSAWQPAEMLRTKGPYTAKKIAFKLLRKFGYNI